MKSVIFSQILISEDYLKQTKVKSNNKIERCFGVIVTLFKFKESENFDQTFELENNVSNTPKGRFTLLL